MPNKSANTLLWRPTVGAEALYVNLISWCIFVNCNGKTYLHIGSIDVEILRIVIMIIKKVNPIKKNMSVLAFGDLCGVICFLKICQVHLIPFNHQAWALCFINAVNNIHIKLWTKINRSKLHMHIRFSSTHLSSYLIQLSVNRNFTLIFFICLSWKGLSAGAWGTVCQQPNDPLWQHNLMSVPAGPVILSTFAA